MTLKGKRKALNNDPAAQIDAIKKAFNGIVPTQPLQRRYPTAAWKEGNGYLIAKLILGKLSVRTSTEKPQTTTLYHNVDVVSSHLSRIYRRRISLLDLRAAVASPIPVPTLEESQTGAICWIKDRNKITFTAMNTGGDDASTVWQYCVVNPDGIRGGTCQGKPKVKEGSDGPLIHVQDVNACIDLLRTAFKLDVRSNEIAESQNKVVKVPQIASMSKQENS